MIVNIAIIFVFLLNVLEINTHYLNSAKNKQDLIKIIKILNGEYDEGTDKHKDNVNKVAKEEDSHELPDDEKEKKLQQMLWLLKKNFNAEKQHQELMRNPLHSGARVYFIKNPEVLEKYQNYIRRKKKLQHLSNEHTDRQRRDYVEDILKKLQRRAEVETGSSESENNEFDRQDSLGNDKEPNISEIIPKQDLIQEKQAEELLENAENIEEKPIKDTNEEHNIRAQDTNNLVRLEKVIWSDKDSKENEEKSFKPKKNKPKTIDSKKERIYDISRETSFVPYRPKPRVNYRKPKSEGKKDYFSFGRTSIPFVGKKGIYDDK